MIMNHAIRCRLSVVVTALLLAVPMTASAQLDVNLNQSLLTVPQGGSAQFVVTIENLTEETIHLAGISSTLGPDIAADDIYDLFFDFGPDTLAPGEGWEGPLLHLTVTSEAPIQTEVYGVNLTGGAHPYDEAELATFFFQLEVVTALSEVPAAAPVANPGGLRVTPNPSAGPMTLQFSLAKSQVVEVQVFDVAGRTVRALFAGEMETGAHQMEWDGLDNSGARSNRGIYFIRVRSNGLALTTKVVRVD